MRAARAVPGAAKIRTVLLINVRSAHRLRSVRSPPSELCARRNLLSNPDLIITREANEGAVDVRMTRPAVASAAAVIFAGAAVLLIYDVGHFSMHMMLHIASMNILTPLLAAWAITCRPTHSNLIEALDRDIQVKNDSSVLGLRNRGISAGRNNQRGCGVGIEARDREGLEAA